ncbi:hypothetical protein CAL26_13135 [Bordetella genomosp. 9]|uniref:DUF3348 domain-containing protein n=1 Tax=Bordetella genomosp. 9 TaxID=1416803 RepID=A0A261R203_9BORD|nr:DUF3348 domain-containing protein [Bordetella genomosp. 9]OZI18650.1 hypothetical protein CAL26_13135 [Bordetella genomosp. 9]
MDSAHRRAGLSGPTLVRLLARLTDIDVSEPRQSLADRLSLWLGWTDAIALSAVLNSNPPTADRQPDSAEEEECARVRNALTNAITEKNRAPRAADSHPRTRAAAAERGRAPAAPVDYGLYRQRYLSLQQAMETGIGNLRTRLRGMMAGRTPAMTQLAAVDAIMEKALGAREHNALAAVPGLLEGYFHRLRRAEAAALAEAEDAGHPPPAAAGAWLDVFRQDMRAILLAELDIRFKPVEGLLAALRVPRGGRAEPGMS